MLSQQVNVANAGSGRRRTDATVTAEMIERLALAVSAGTRGPVLTLNDKGGKEIALTPDGVQDWRSIAELGQDDLPFMVNLREGVLALDCDITDGQLPDWLSRARTLCVADRCRLVEVTSGGSAGGRHLFIVLPVAWTSEDYKHRLVDRAGVLPDQIRSLGRDVRPPLSVHPAGGQGELIQPATAHEALALLQGRACAAPLSDDMRKLLKDGTDEGSRRKLVYRLAIAFVNAGLTFGDYRTALLDSSNRAGTVLFEKYHAAAREARLKGDWERAVAWVRKNPAQTGEAWLGTLNGLLTTETSYPFQTNNDRLAYREFVGVCATTYHDEVSVSVRRLAERIGCTDRTAQNVLRRLRSHGLLRPLDAAPTGRPESQSAWYRVLAQAGENYHSSNLQEGNRGSTVELFPTFGSDGMHPAFSRGALPPTAGFLWNAMPEGIWQTVTQMLSLVPGRSRDTIRGALAALQSAGLVDRNTPSGHKWVKQPASEGHLDRLPGVQESVQRREERKAQHAVDRRVHEHWQERNGAPAKQCQGVKKADGQPCGAWAVQIGPDRRAEFCRQHLPHDHPDRLAWETWRNGTGTLALAT